MELKTFEGYWQNGQFHPFEEIDIKHEKIRAKLTLLPDEEPKKIKDMNYEERLAWLDMMEKSIDDALHEDHPFELFARSKEMRPPIIWDD
ncbi:MAG: hypothetical protein FWC67_03770 [Defluviitaleaceae bacterium]|nr:hypothetical protein [Defluviitaleaceae bacterium]